MARNVNVIPLADESLGVRSMSVAVEAGHTFILLDAGVSLGPSRYGLPPHPAELEKLVEARRRILSAAKQADIVLVSHFHKDHYTPPDVGLYEASSPEVFSQIYRGKEVFIIDPSAGLTRNQVNRARAFTRALKGAANIFRLTHDSRVDLGDCKLVARLYKHGSGKLGLVLGVYLLVDEEVVVAYLPDVQGPIYRKDAEEIVGMDPRILIIGGPPSYLAASGRVSKDSIRQGVENLAYIISSLAPSGTQVYISHHLLRDPLWDEILEARGVDRSSFYLYSDYYHREAELLEAYRRELYAYDPPPKGYGDILRRSMHMKTEEFLSKLR